MVLKCYQQQTIHNCSPRTITNCMMVSCTISLTSVFLGSCHLHSFLCWSSDTRTSLMFKLSSESNLHRVESHRERNLWFFFSFFLRYILSIVKTEQVRKGDFQFRNGWDWPDHSWESGLSSWSPTWVQEPKNLASTALPGTW